MSASSFGNFFRVTTFGESHGPAMGVVIDGCPAGVTWNQNLLVQQLQRRRPGFSPVVSQRKEEDVPEVLSGVYEGMTLGTPIAMAVKNSDARSKDYDKIKSQPRPGHADDVWINKFGHVDHRGGGRSSGRETISRVMAGAVGQMLVQALNPNVAVLGFASQIGPLQLSADEMNPTYETIEASIARFPGHEQGVETLLTEALKHGKSYGGTAELRVSGVPAGLGQPVFHKLKADLAAAIMSVGATAGFEVGEGRGVATEEGSEFHQRSESPYGGLRGGISTGESIGLRVFFKPTSSVLDVAKQGRHDPCIVPRAIPVLESMVWITLADHFLWQRADRV